MENKEKFIKQIMNNLNNNGFPAKKVSFDVEKMYEIADTKGLSFNSILEELKQDGIDSEITVDKVIFKSINETPNMDEDMFAKAQEMLSKMSPEEIQNIKNMYENMSDEEKAQMMDQAKNMGMF